ncbi:MAG: prenyltransferase/squalene oxidase repeat-containing protein [Limisphaerales bacterium]
MSIRLEMLQVARLAPKLLGDSTDLVKNFFFAQQNKEGGFQDRVGQSDLYYTVFGLDGLVALQADLSTDKIENFLRQFEIENLNFIHLCCLARGWAAILQAARNECAAELKTKILKRLETFRSHDGGFNARANSDFGTAYGGFLAFAVYQDLKVEFPNPLRLVHSLKFLETEDGAWTNEVLSPQSRVLSPKSDDTRLKTQDTRLSLIGSTNATAAAVTLLRNLSMPINSSVGDWLLKRAHPQGGFLATPNAPVPDLLSTATTLHALSGLQRDFSQVKEKTLDFIDTLWSNEGGFHGHWGDDDLDCEYTFYGLLALGHLSL